MGPTILLDKSTLQAISQHGISELIHYFHVTVAPVLLFEILADLEKVQRRGVSSIAQVQTLARKLTLAGSAKVNVDFRAICLNELLGWHVPMNGVPIVGGARRVITGDGEHGIYLPNQPEMDAVWRWSSGQFSENERAIAMQWRESLQSLDPDSARRSLPPLVKQADTLDEVNNDVEKMLDDDEGQRLFVRRLIKLISPASARDVVEEWTFRRWSTRNYEPLTDFAPYSRHCIKVSYVFHLAFVNKLIPTTRSSWVDVEYLYYTPFAQIFSSGDQLHEKMAGFVLRKDQSFVPRDRFVNELHSLAKRRRVGSPAQGSNALEPKDIEPEEGSCIYGLWVRHLGRFRPQFGPRAISDDGQQRIMDKVRAFIEAVRRDEKSVPRRVWPG